MKSVYFLEIYCRKHQANYPKQLQLEMIQIQSNYLNERDSFSFLSHPLNQINWIQQKSKISLAKSKPLIINQKQNVKKKIRKPKKSSSIDEISDEETSLKNNITIQSKNEKIEKVIADLRQREKTNINNFDETAHKIEKNKEENQFSNKSKNSDNNPDFQNFLKVDKLNQSQNPKKISTPSKNFNRNDIDLEIDQQFDKLLTDKIQSKKLAGIKTDPIKSNDQIRIKENDYSRVDKLTKVKSQTIKSDLSHRNEPLKMNRLDKSGISLMIEDKASDSYSKSNSNNTNEKKKNEEKKTLDKKKSKKEENHPPKIDDKIMSQFTSLLKNSNIDQKKASELLMSLGIKRKLLVGEEDQLKPKKKIKTILSNTVNSNSNEQSSSNNKLSSDDSFVEKSNVIPFKKSVQTLVIPKKSNIQKQIAINPVNSITKLIKKPKITIENEIPGKNKISQGFSTLEKLIQIEISPKILPTIKETIEIENKESPLNLDSPPEINFLKDVNDDSSHKKSNDYIAENQMNLEEGLKKDNTTINFELPQKKVEKIENPFDFGLKNENSKFPQEKIKSTINFELKTENPTKNISENNEKPQNSGLFDLIEEKKIDQTKKNEENPAPALNTNKVLIKHNDLEKLPPKIIKNGLTSKENSELSDEITYLETHHKPEEKIERINKLKSLVGSSEKKSLRKTKESFLLTSGHVWGNVFSNIYKIEFENSSDLISKISEGFASLKFLN